MTKPPSRYAISVGMFDGVHLGHAYVLSQLTQLASNRGLRTKVYTFDEHPKGILTGQHYPLLTTPEERVEKIKQHGVSAVEVLSATPSLLRLSASDFIQSVLYPSLDGGLLLMGHDHSFGRGREGTYDHISHLSKSSSFEVIQSEICTLSTGIRPSTTLIRDALNEGDVGKAAALLGYDYSVSGIVIQGDRRGRQLGFPTANIDVDPTSKTLPKEGVYAGLVTIKGDTKAYPAISNWGGRPTFGDNQALLEVHLLDVDENLYGETLTVTFSKRIRNIKRMSSLEALQAQLHEDAMFCRRMYASYFAKL